MIDWPELLMGATALALGGVLKGATGAGAPLLAVPVLAMLYDIRLAVALFTFPSLVPNIWQGWAYRHNLPPSALVFGFALGGAVGAGVGTAMLVSLSPDLLMLGVAVAVLIYVTFRLAQPDWALDMRVAVRLAVPMGLAGGVLQGATGLSAPVSITFMNAIRMERRAFIAAIAVFFAVMAVIQIPLLVAWGVLTPMRAVLSAGALLPLMGAMPLGAALASRMSPAAFDRIILGLLTLISVRIGIGALMSFR
ncbi:sulfite exporter TauE/SafE family protein [uncultured Jannaschia sp.]|uniref:sulfite exporter TauE/SafE family protein n=1 Tax=uncultured Jannaschia sp. TaxID=293347 RepID=UPI002625DFB6|nr:sulfite exporter TauE/SafE family protein [uncultured Jannaschia sp.]